MNKINKLLIIFTTLLIVLLGFYGLNKYIFNYKIQNIKNNLKINLPEKPIIGPFNKNIDNATVLVKDNIIKITNDYRLNNNLIILTEDELLNKIANEKLEDMIKYNYFEHISPIDGKDISWFAQINNYIYLFIGENLAMGDFFDEKDLVDAWMDSQGHRENILNSDYTQIGVAVKKDQIKGVNTWISVQVFAKPSSDCQIPDSVLKKDIENMQTKYDFSLIKILQDEGKKMIDEGNAKITRGNEIYNETKNEEEAKKYWDDGENLYNIGKNKIDESNNLINIYNELKKQIEFYNIQIEKYNQCLGI